MVVTCRPNALVIVIETVPAPENTGSWGTWNGPGETWPDNTLARLTSTSTVDGTAAPSRPAAPGRPTEEFVPK